jgi:FSR family fosmidomycin resistance protein-like MFS transporter
MGVLTGLLPLFKEQLGLTNAQTGFLAFVLSASGSLLQPVFGLVADAIRSRWFVAAVIVWDAGFVSLLGSRLVPADSADLHRPRAGLGGFHPYGASGAVMVSERSSLNTSMSFYTVGGTSGYAFGPWRRLRSSRRSGCGDRRLRGPWHPGRVRPR